jgi:hypothetical protein
MPRKSNIEARYKHCGICSQLADEEYAFQRGVRLSKYGREEQNTYLPPPAKRLQVVRVILPGSRSLQLQQCPECKTYYLYRTDYEFLTLEPKKRRLKIGSGLHWNEMHASACNSWSYSTYFLSVL